MNPLDIDRGHEKGKSNGQTVKRGQRGFCSECQEDDRPMYSTIMCLRCRTKMQVPDGDYRQCIVEGCKVIRESEKRGKCKTHADNERRQNKYDGPKKIVTKQDPMFLAGMEHANNKTRSKLDALWHGKIKNERSNGIPLTPRRKFYRVMGFADLYKPTDLAA